jgi:hypothetical protein
VKALSAFLANPLVRGDVADALAGSPSPDAMRAIEAAANQPALRHLAVRAYVVRALVRGERTGAMNALVAGLARDEASAERALGAFARIALGEARAAEYVRDRDPRVRRAAAMAALADPTPEALRALLTQRAVERDDDTRVVLGIGLLDGDPEGRVSTSALVDRAESGEADAPLAAMALARRGDEAYEAKVDALLAARDPVLRAHAARGLGASAAKNASGRLADAYAYEPSVLVRRAIVNALAARTEDLKAPSRQGTLEIASRFDPDRAVRWVAARALAGKSAKEPIRPSLVPEVAWLRVADPEGKSPSAAGGPFRAALVREDGLALPIAFDEDGYALVPGVPPGEARLVLSPRVPRFTP